LADIGTGHALLPLYLVENGTVTRAIAVEKEAGPASLARSAVAARGLADRIEIRIGDGLSPLRPKEAEIIVIAGLGGEKITAILAADIEIARTAHRLILQPMNRAAPLRRWLVENGWQIEAENLVAERQKLYPVIAATPGTSERMDWLEEELGPCLLASQHPLLEELIKRLTLRYEKAFAGLSKAPHAGTAARRKELARRLAELRALLQKRTPLL